MFARFLRNYLIIRTFSKDLAVLCKTHDFMLYQQLKRPNAPPFLGLLSLSERSKGRAIAEVREFLKGNPSGIPGLFNAFSYVSGWVVTHALNDSYGGDDHKIYAHIEEVLGVSLATQKARRELHSAFLSVCDRLGLPSRGLERMVDLYLLHAGVPKGQLQHLIEAFMRQHRLFGAPPDESTMLLNNWEDQSLELLIPSIITPRRSILWDETAWHAGLYARISADCESFRPQTPFEEAFLICYKEAEKSRGSGATGAVAPPKPRLYWGEDGLALRLPRASGRIPVRLDGSARAMRLKSGEDWALQQPWPRQIAGEIDGRAFALEFLQDETTFAVFDMAIGQQLAEKKAAGLATLELDTSDALIAARRPFSLNGLAASPLGDGCFIQRVPLNSTGTDLVFGVHRVALRTKPRRRLSLFGGQIANGARGKLFGPEAIVRVETGLGSNETRQIRLTLDGREVLIDVEIIEGVGQLALSESLLQDFPSNPARLRLELMAPLVKSGELRLSGIAIEAWFWPGFIAAEGLSLRSVLPPSNFLADQSTHIDASVDGLQLDPRGGYAHANAAFGIDGEAVAFRFGWPDITLQRHRVDGSVSSVQTGSRISVGVEDRFGHVSIRCSDRGASLRVGDRKEAAPFALGMTRNISISELVEQNGKAIVVLKRSNGAEVVLFEIVNALEPTRFEIRASGDGLRMVIALGTGIDAIGIEAEDELGQRIFHEIALGRRPTSSAAPDWLQALPFRPDSREVVLTVSQRLASNGLIVGRVFVRPDSARLDESWCPLRNVRGDSFALPLTVAHSLEQVPNDNVKIRFETLSRWISDCYAAECWQDQGLERSLMSRWRTLGRVIADLPMGAGLLIQASLLSAPDETSSSWVPIVHPVEIDPGLYSTVPSAFQMLGDQSDDGLRAGSRLGALSQERLRDGMLHVQALMAFENSKQAEASGEALRGFNSARFFSLFAPLDTDLAAGWFWHGSPLLGPAHLRAAFLSMIDKFEAARVFIGAENDIGGNSRRNDALVSLSNVVWAQASSAQRPQIPKRRTEDEHPTSSDVRVVTTLSEFARASRNGTAGKFVEDLARQLGWRQSDVLSSLGFLLRLAPELFFYFLLVWQLAKVRA